MDTAENRPVQPEVPPAPKNRDAGGRVILVQLFQSLGTYLAAKSDKRLKSAGKK